MPRFSVDTLAARLCGAARRQNATPKPPAGRDHWQPNDSRSFTLNLGGALVRAQLDQIDGEPLGTTLRISGLNPDAAEAVLRLLATRNEPNGREP